MAAFNLSEKSTDNSENESADNSESESESPDISADIPDYTFIFKSQTTINFDIKLNNPKNYYIMDFKLTCDEEQIEYYDKEMENGHPSTISGFVGVVQTTKNPATDSDFPTLKSPQTK